MDKDPPVTPPGTASNTAAEESEILTSPEVTIDRKGKGKARVRFNSTAEARSPPPFPDRSGAPKTTDDDELSIPKPKPRPSVLRANSYHSVVTLPRSDGDDAHVSEQSMSAHAAHERATQVAATLFGSLPAPDAKQNPVSPDLETAHSSHELLPTAASAPLEELSVDSSSRHDGTNDETAPKDQSAEEHTVRNEAYELVRSYTRRHNSIAYRGPGVGGELSSDHVEPAAKAPEEREAEIYVPPPQQYRDGILTNLLRLHNHETCSRPPSYHSSAFTTPASSGASTPKKQKWYHKNKSQDTLANLVEASARLANIHADRTTTSPSNQPSRPKRPRHKRNLSSGVTGRVRSQNEDEIRITMHIAEVISRQRYLLKMCRAMMLYGAPSHRLEEFLRMSARVLEIDGHFLYLPGCMIISFDDRSTHTSEVKIVRETPGIDLGKLKDVHEIYKSAAHDVYSVDDAIERLSAVMDRKDKFPAWSRVLAFGLASATVAPFAFQGRFIDMGFCFLLGSAVGALQILVTPKSDLYHNIFEISASVLTSFLSRALGSTFGGGKFCFSAMAQSSIALILPGFIVLSAALELQSRAIVPGSIRMVYAVIYSLFLGFGITVGTALYGLADPNAVSTTSCSDPIPPNFQIFFVPVFTLCLAVVNQAKFKQMPVMVMIAFAGYIVNFFAGPKLVASPQIANTLGAFVSGLLANLYSRLQHGVAVTALLPAVFVQVPSGLAATGSLLSGLSTANNLTNSAQPLINGTGGLQIEPNQPLGNVVFNVAASMIQIAIGITLGLFLSSLCVYPFGKKRSGLWTL